MNAEQTNEEGRLEPATKPPHEWRAEADSFASTLVESIRAGDTASIIVLLDCISREAVSVLSSEDEGAPEELGTMLDRLVCVIATAIRFRQPLLLDVAVKTAFGVYMSGFDESGGSRIPTGTRRRASSSLLWFELAKRIIAAGGFAVRRGDWRAVRKLALQTTTDRYSASHGENQYWLRHAVKEAANAGIFDTQNAREEDGSLISAALRLVGTEPCFRPELPADDHRLLHSLLEFDLLAALVISADAGGFDTYRVYPSFIYWNLYQVEPLLARLLRNKEMRDELFPSAVEDEFLARVLRALAKLAGRRSTGWSNWSGQAVINFLSKYPDTSS
jgi:hypothetical protein